MKTKKKTKEIKQARKAKKHFPFHCENCDTNLMEDETIWTNESDHACKFCESDVTNY